MCLEGRGNLHTVGSYLCLQSVGDSSIEALAEDVGVSSNLSRVFGDEVALSRLERIYREWDLAANGIFTAKIFCGR